MLTFWRDNCILFKTRIYALEILLIRNVFSNILQSFFFFNFAGILKGLYNYLPRQTQWWMVWGKTRIPALCKEHFSWIFIVYRREIKLEWCHQANIYCFQEIWKWLGFNLLSVVKDYALVIKIKLVMTFNFDFNWILCKYYLFAILQHYAILKLAYIFPSCVTIVTFTHSSLPSRVSLEDFEILDLNTFLGNTCINSYQWLWQPLILFFFHGMSTD